MKKIKSYLGLTVAVCLVFALAACSSGNQDQIIQKVIDAYDGINKTETAIDLAVELSVSGQTMSMTSAGTIIEQRNPLLGYVNMEIKTSASSAAIKSESYVEMQDNKLVCYTSVGEGWQKITTELTNSSQFLQTENMNVYLKNAKSFKEIGVEQIGGRDVIKLEGLVTGSSIEEVIKNSDFFKGSDSSTLPANTFSNLGDMPMTLWVDKTSYLPVKFECNLTDIMKTVLKNLSGTPSMGGVEIVANKYLMTMTILKTNDDVADVVIPDEVRTSATETAI